MINLIASLAVFTGNYGSAQYPVTYDVIDTIKGAFNIFMIGFITFYTGVLVWKERDAKINEIQDATPIKTGVLFYFKISCPDYCFGYCFCLDNSCWNYCTNCIWLLQLPIGCLPQINNDYRVARFFFFGCAFIVVPLFNQQSIYCLFCFRHFCNCK